MKTLYFDCSSGISGNMVLGALTELVGDRQVLTEELKKLNIQGYEIHFTESQKLGIKGTHVEVLVDGEDEYGHVHSHHHDHDHSHSHGEHHDHAHHHHDHDHSHSHGEHHDHAHHHHDHDHSHSHGNHHGHSHSHGHHHAHRNLEDVYAVIDNSSLSAPVRDLAKRIFLRVAKAESKVHGKPLSEVHFHEVGAIDSIIDIVGTAILVDRIQPDRILSSVVNDGHGFIQCAHGTMSVPVPATSEILADSDVLFRQIDVDTELVTPTGAAIIAELASAFLPLPPMKIDKIGWGAGTKDLPIPNLLKVYLGEGVLTEEVTSGEGIPEKIPAGSPAGISTGQKGRAEEAGEAREPEQPGEAGVPEGAEEAGGPREPDQPDQEEILVMETNIDDCRGEILGYTMECLLEKGALDVWYTPIYMKKNRPAYLLSVACFKEDRALLQEIIFRETTTLGIRYYTVKRTKLGREEVLVETPHGRVRAKKAFHGEESYLYPEYESLKELARSKGIPLKNLYQDLT